MSFIVNILPELNLSKDGSSLESHKNTQEGSFQELFLLASAKVETIDELPRNLSPEVLIDPEFLNVEQAKTETPNPNRAVEQLESCFISSPESYISTSDLLPLQEDVHLDGVNLKEVPIVEESIKDSHYLEKKIEEDYDDSQYKLSSEPVISESIIGAPLKRHEHSLTDEDKISKEENDFEGGIDLIVDRQSSKLLPNDDRVYNELVLREPPQKTIEQESFEKETLEKEIDSPVISFKPESKDQEIVAVKSLYELGFKVDYSDSAEGDKLELVEREMASKLPNNLTMLPVSQELEAIDLYKPIVTHQFLKDDQYTPVASNNTLKEGSVEYIMKQISLDNSELDPKRKNDLLEFSDSVDGFFKPLETDIAEEVQSSDKPILMTASKPEEMLHMLKNVDSSLYRNSSDFKESLDLSDEMVGTVESIGGSEQEKLDLLEPVKLASEKLFSENGEENIRANFRDSELPAIVKSIKEQDGETVQLDRAIDQVKIKLFHNLENGQSNFQMKLSPAELGNVEVRAELQESGEMKLFFTVDKVDSLHALQKDIKVLEEALRNIGIETNASHEFNLKEGNKQHGNNFSQFAQHKKEENDNNLEQDLAELTYKAMLDIDNNGLRLDIVV
jgi:hypothetical protein